MSMEERDIQELQRMVEEYDINELVKSLTNIIDQRAGQLIDLGLNEQAKKLTQASWHMDTFLSE